MPDPLPDPSVKGELTANISNSAVRLIAEYTGRGPTRARTTISNSWVFITLEDTLTKGERQLVAHGFEETVLQTRRQYQQAMQARLEAAVEEHTGRRVIAFMSENHIDPDVGLEAFLLEPEGDTPVE